MVRQARQFWIEERQMKHWIRIFSLLLALYGLPLKAEEQPLVTGIGGLFFRSESPAALAAWYERHFAINRVPTSYEQAPWQQASGPTVFAPFAADTTYFGEAKHQWMLNLRVRDIDELVSRLRGSDIEVSDPEQFPNGRFARLVDPEGNPIELWEPATPNPPK
jgi:predicted enzyme related to lactoylglutathione lyase